jgi:CO/xanthine dehydrogenase Mo-binding subunit
MRRSRRLCYRQTPTFRIRRSLSSEDDPHTDLAHVKGIGDIGIRGSAAAVANAIYHATGHACAAFQ